MSIAEPAVTPDQPGTRAWESEGGALKPSTADPLPDGITAETVTLYRVGPYSYAKLADARAEHARQART